MRKDIAIQHKKVFKKDDGSRIKVVVNIDIRDTLEYLVTVFTAKKGKRVWVSAVDYRSEEYLNKNYAERRIFQTEKNIEIATAERINTTLLEMWELLKPTTIKESDGLAFTQRQEDVICSHLELILKEIDKGISHKDDNGIDFTAYDIQSLVFFIQSGAKFDRRFKGIIVSGLTQRAEIAKSEEDHDNLNCMNEGIKKIEKRFAS